MTWHAIVTTPRGEFRADQEFKEAGIIRFLPSYKINTLMRYSKARVKTVEQPLMPGYLLADIDFSKYSRHPGLINRMKFVAGIVGIKGKPTPLRSSVVHDLKELCLAGRFDQGRKRGQDKRFLHGDRVMITEGTWAGFVVTFRETAGGMLKPRMGYVSVMFDRLFGSDKFAMDVPQSILVAA